MRAPVQRRLPLVAGQEEEAGLLLEAETPELDPAQRLWIRGDFDELFFGTSIVAAVFPAFA